MNSLSRLLFLPRPWCMGQPRMHKALPTLCQDGPYSSDGLPCIPIKMFKIKPCKSGHNDSNRWIWISWGNIYLTKTMCPVEMSIFVITGSSLLKIFKLKLICYHWQSFRMRLILTKNCIERRRIKNNINYLCWWKVRPHHKIHTSIHTILVVAKLSSFQVFSKAKREGRGAYSNQEEVLDLEEFVPFSESLLAILCAGPRIGSIFSFVFDPAIRARHKSWKVSCNQSANFLSVLHFLVLRMPCFIKTTLSSPHSGYSQELHNLIPLNVSSSWYTNGRGRCWRIFRIHVNIYLTCMHAYTSNNNPYFYF